MTKKLSHHAVQATVIALALSLFVPAAHAERHQFELVAGYYFTSNIELPELGVTLGMDDDTTYGLRYGYRRSEKIGFGVMWTHLEVDAAREDRAEILCSACDFDANFVDFSLEFYPGGGNFSIFGGPGWVTGDFTVRVPGPDNNVNASDDSFTFHAGLAYMFEVGESFYIRPEFRFRFLELDTDGDARYDDEDSQFGLGFGWRF